MKNKVVFIAKTDINTDGRILNEIRILTNRFRNLHIDFILLPDKPIKTAINDRVKFHEINCSFRNSPAMRLFTVLEFTIRALFKLKSLQPSVIHVQDSATCLPVYLYKTFYEKTKIIYDDHELPNKGTHFLKKINDFFENKLIRRADYLIEANEERLDYIIQELQLSNIKGISFLNLPYENKELSVDDVNKQARQALNALYEESKKVNFVIHQGPLSIERGRSLLADLVKMLPSNFKVMILGGNRESFNEFVEEYSLNEDAFFFVGTVDYDVLPFFWRLGTLSVIMYLPTYLNNRLCAPNRFYLSLQNGVPTIVNKDNPVLRSFIQKYNNGFFIEDILKKGFPQAEQISSKHTAFSYEALCEEQISKLTGVYQEVLNT